MQRRRPVSLCREDDFKGASFPDHREESGFIVSFCMTDGQGQGNFWWVCSRGQEAAELV